MSRKSKSLENLHVAELELPSGKLSSLTRKKNELLILIEAEPPIEKDIVEQHYSVYGTRLDSIEADLEEQLQKSLSSENREKLEIWRKNLRDDVDEFRIKIQEWMRSNITAPDSRRKPFDMMSQHSSQRSNASSVQARLIEAKAKSAAERKVLQQKQKLLKELDDLEIEKMNEYEKELDKSLAAYGNNSEQNYRQREKDGNNSDVLHVLMEYTQQSLLPKNEPEIFDGSDITKYLPFCKSFEVNIEKRCSNELDKLHFLEKYTGGIVKEIVKSCFGKGENGYKSAKELLDKKYNNEFKIADSYLQKLHDFPSMKQEDAKGMEEFSLLLITCKNVMENMSSLNQLNSPKEMSSIIKKLPYKCREKWRSYVFDLSEKSKSIDFESLVKFVEKQSMLLSLPVFGNIKDDKDQGLHDKHIKDKSTSYSAKTNQNLKRQNLTIKTEFKKSPTCKSLYCPCCKKSNSHELINCFFFKKKSMEEKEKFIKENNICFGCLASTAHRSSGCNQRLTCEKCNRRHPTCFHREIKQDKPNTNITVPEVATTCSGPNTYVENSKALKVDSQIGTGLSSKILHAVLPIKIKNRQGQFVNTYMALDNYASDCFMSMELFNKLGYTGRPEQLSLTTMDGKNKYATLVLNNLCITDLDGNLHETLPTVYTTKNWPFEKDDAPSQNNMPKIFENLEIPIQFIDENIGLLVGANMPSLLKPIEVISDDNENSPFAVLYKFGWTICGPSKGSDSSNSICYRTKVAETPDLDEKIDRFFSEDFQGSNDDAASLSIEDRRFLNIVDKSISLVNGNFSVDLPFKYDNVDQILPNNYFQCLNSIKYSKKRFLKNESYFNEYSKFVDLMLDSNYAKKVPDNEINSKNENRPAWYLAHHGVYHPAKGKLRVVFNCSLAYQNVSLNDILLQGPDLANNLIDVLLRFRQGKIAFLADIYKMFYQVRVPDKHQDMLRFFWFPNNDLNKEPEVYKLCVHLFGAKSSPSVANFALKKTASLNTHLYSKVARDSVMNDFYVDDLVKSVNTVDEARTLIAEICSIVAQGGFNLTSFSSSSKELLDSLPSERLAKPVDPENTNILDEGLPYERALGVTWQIANDTLTYSLRVPNEKCTKRGILSTTFSVFDPYGIAAPVILPAKRIFQQCCHLKLGWDEELPIKLTESWVTWKSDIHKLSEFEIKRWYCNDMVENYTSVQLHIFADGSDIAYAAVGYLRFEYQNIIHCSLVMCKSRLTPLSNTALKTTPRIELTAAFLAVKVKNIVINALNLKIDDIFYWVDSETVLKYIANETSRFQRFVANKVSFIRANSEIKQWNYVPSESNIADVASRGLKVDDFLELEEWKSGPRFLFRGREHWPRSPVSNVNDDVDLEVKKSVFVVNKTEETPSPMDALLEASSSWHKTKVNVAYFLKLKSLLKNKKDGSTFVPSKKLSISDINDAEIAIWKYLQYKNFDETLKLLTNNNELPRKHPLAKLHPFIDDNGLLRVGGRLSNLDAPYDTKYPIILGSGTTNNNHILNLLINDVHVQVGHLGVKTIMATLRRRYWVIKGNTIVKKLTKNCIVCRKNHGKNSTQLMADLPSDRLIADQKPFSNVGIDCFGPFVVTRGRATEKRYGIIFTCLSSRAIHLEILFSLETDSFLCALSRFIARRGPIKIIRSDNATNFKGGNKVLDECIKNWNNKSENYMLQHKIEWIYNPPTGSHHGGVWEREIRSVRNVLNGLLSEQKVKLSDERLYTLICEVEGILNSRPLTELSDDINDLEPLTPNHLLLADSVISFPPGLFNEQDLYSKKRWRQVQYLAGLFWSRWRKEYLPLLQQRQKWFTDKKPHKVGDLVLITDDNLPRNLWSTGRIVEVHKDKVDRVRSAKIKVAKAGSVKGGKKIVCDIKVVTKPITKLIMLRSVDKY